MSKRMFLLLALVAGLAMAMTAAHAATYYVSTTGNDANGGTSYADAWATIDNGDAMGVLNPGDTVMVAPGTYMPPGANPVLGVQLANNSGTAAQPITYKADGAGVIVDNTPASQWEKKGLYVTASHLVIDGFEVTNATEGIYVESAVGVEIKNCQIYGLLPTEGNPMFPSSTGIYIAGSTSDLVAHHNIFHDINGGWGAGTAIMDSAHGNAFHNNVVYSITGAIQMALVLRSSTGDSFYNNTVIGGWYGVDAEIPWGPTTVTVTNNIFGHVNGQALYEDGGGAQEIFSSHNLFYNSNPYGNVWPGPGDISGNPQFVDELNHDYHLLLGSLAIDAGIDVGLPYYGAAPDIGAFEYVPEPASAMALAGGLLCLAGIIRRRA